MLVRVFEIPEPSGNRHFGGGEAQSFIEVDWFRDDEGMMLTDLGRSQMRKFVSEKRYFDSTKAYLILHPIYPTTIGYDPDAMLLARASAAAKGDG